MFDKNTILNPQQAFVFEIGCYHSHRNADHEIVDTSADFINDVGVAMDTVLQELDDPNHNKVETRRYLRYMSKAVFTAYLVLRTVRYCQKGPAPVRAKAKNEYIRFIETLGRDLRTVKPNEISYDDVDHAIGTIMDTREVMMHWLLPIAEVYAIIAMVDHSDIREFLHARIKEGSIFSQSYGNALKSWLMRDLNWRQEFITFMTINALSKKVDGELATIHIVDQYFNHTLASYHSTM